MKYIFGIVVVALGVSLFLSWTYQVDLARRAISNCVVATAQLEGYSGDVNSRDAWLLFSRDCADS